MLRTCSEHVVYINKKQFVYTTCSEHVLSLQFSCNSMNTLLSYCGLVDTKIRASEKDLPVEMTTETNGNGIHVTNGKHYGLNGNHGEYPNVTVVNSRSVNYLLTKLRNKDTEAKVCTKTLTLKKLCKKYVQFN